MRRVLRLYLFVSIGLLLAAAGADSKMAQCPFPPPAPAPPPPVCPVDGLVFGAPAAFGWGAAPPACGPVLYDAAADGVVPPVGSGFWYLSRAATPGPDFTWNEVGPANAYDRDVLLVGICPL